MEKIMRMLGQALVISTLGVAIAAQPAHAGRKCELTEQSVNAMVNGVRLASKTKEALEKANLQAGIIARVGQDLSEYGQFYSHIGFVYRDGKNPQKPIWRVVHKLNHCGSNRADLFRQGLVEFFTDTPHKLATAVLPFTPAVAQQVISTLTDTRRVAMMHEPRYNLVAYPWSVKYQQSNQWVTETLAMSIESQIRQRRQAQQWLSFKGYEPGILRISSFQQFGAKLTKSNVRFDDHPSENRLSQKIHTTTADSVMQWSRQIGITQPPILIEVKPTAPLSRSTPARTQTVLR